MPIQFFRRNPITKTLEPIEPRTTASVPQDLQSFIQDVDELRALQSRKDELLSKLRAAGYTDTDIETAMAHSKAIMERGER
jgi:hypothetical protein